MELNEDDSASSDILTMMKATEESNKEFSEMELTFQTDLSIIDDSVQQNNNGQQQIVESVQQIDIIQQNDSVKQVEPFQVEADLETQQMGSVDFAEQLQPELDSGPCDQIDTANEFEGDDEQQIEPLQKEAESVMQVDSEQQQDNHMHQPVDSAQETAPERRDVIEQAECGQEVGIIQHQIDPPQQFDSPVDDVDLQQEEIVPEQQLDSVPEQVEVPQQGGQHQVESGKVEHMCSDEQHIPFAGEHPESMKPSSSHPDVFELLYEKKTVANVSFL